MPAEDLKVAVLNTVAFGLSMSAIETTLKIILLIVSGSLFMDGFFN